jgi:hypothetical protein
MAAELNVFERVNRADPKSTSPELCIKKAVRNYDEKERQPQNIRTFGALCRTMNRLMQIMDSTEEELVEVHSFLWDRFREVRAACGPKVCGYKTVGHLKSPVWGIHAW